VKRGNRNFRLKKLLKSDDKKNILPSGGKKFNLR
jgi:hypothetical protein